MERSLGADRAVGYDRRAPALVLVVSSMAGGAGASMALDVCRLLSMVPNTNPSKVAVFMVSPGRVRHPARPGAHRRPRERARHAGRDRRQPDRLRPAATTSSCCGCSASPTGRARRSRSPASSRSAGPWARSGRSSVTGTPDAVYRGLARGLAGLMTSDVASEEFASIRPRQPRLRRARPAAARLGRAPPPLPWGSFGFASISMGRDRYAEYAAQRIARSAVDRLLDGHLRPAARHLGHRPGPGAGRGRVAVGLRDARPAGAGLPAPRPRRSWRAGSPTVAVPRSGRRERDGADRRSGRSA